MRSNCKTHQVFILAASRRFIAIGFHVYCWVDRNFSLFPLISMRYAINLGMWNDLSDLFSLFFVFPIIFQMILALLLLNRFLFALNYQLTFFNSLVLVCFALPVFLLALRIGFLVQYILKHIFTIIFVQNLFEVIIFEITATKGGMKTVFDHFLVLWVWKSLFL